MIIHKLRRDIEQAIIKFKPSPERNEDIRRIKLMLKGNNANLVRAELSNYLNNISTGFLSILPFLEVNRFQHTLRQVLEVPKYHETNIIKTIAAESGIFLDKDNVIDGVENSLSKRVKKIEEELDSQKQKIGGLQQEIQGLKAENKNLRQLLATMSAKNKDLISENEALKKENGATKKEAQDIKEKYELLKKENASLKQKLQKLPSSTQGGYFSLWGDASKEKERENERKSVTLSAYSILKR